MELIRPDKPIDLRSEDKFQRYNFAQEIAKIVSSGNYTSSLVVGIYGKWGEGKTSVMNFIKAEIPKDTTVIINFNPWRFSDENQLIHSFFSSIAVALKKRLISRSKRALELLGNYGDSIGSLSNIVLPGSGLVFNAGKKMAEKLNKESIEELKKKVDDLIIEANCNFVVFIDDIDRLNVEEVQAVFKLVKLLGDFPRTTYILSFDEDMVAAALGPKYGNRDKTSGYDFLEKIIQIPLHLPKAN
ncbi:MAG TPA: P-loop NTPase fold protein, partial [Puia sp.]|nr:P-loop NTPase fold protein [Puia sp.]